MLHKFIINDLSASVYLGQQIAKSILPNLIITLTGELGTGKTTLTRSILYALGIKGIVKSPTFTLVEPYQLPNYVIYHFDLYRFTAAEEWLDAGFDEYFNQPHLAFIEWAEHAAEFLPRVDWQITLELIHEQQREITINALTEMGEKCLSQLISSGGTYLN